ncbi:MAG: hypothetical protein IJM47_02855 [Synergistaceae bacterium]|nr:hypothetical protein [Synergistaceae bacterium]
MMTGTLKRADAVIRWLERMKKSYRSGRLEAALMDAECARADLEELRNGVFADIAKPERNHGMLRLALITLTLVLLTVTPLSYEEIPVNVPEPLVLAEPIKVVREEPKAVTPAKPKKAMKPMKRQTVQQPQPQREKPVKTVAYDKVNELVKTGQRALRNEDRARRN